MFGVGREARHASFARTAIDSRCRGESGRIEDEMWAEGMVEKWPIFRRRRALLWRFLSRAGLLRKEEKKTRDRRRKKNRATLYLAARRKVGHREAAGVKGGGCLPTWIIMFVTRILVEVVAIGRNNGNGERARWSSLYHLTDAADTRQYILGSGKRS